MAALRVALCLTHFAEWLMPPRLSVPAPRKVFTPDVLNSTLSSLDPTSSSIPARRVQLDIPFFIEPDTEITITDATDLSKARARTAWPRANGTVHLLKYRAEPNRRRAWGPASGQN